jgi:predicted Zn-dependent protease
MYPLPGIFAAGFVVTARRIATMVLVGVLLFIPSAVRAQGPSLIRDTEIENTIRVYIAPLLQAAGLDAGSVRIHLVNDRRLNAFVAGGMQIFIHTGLLTSADSPDQVIGVLAHEIGHIEGGHLSRLKDGLRSATAQAILVSILGGAAAVAAGRPDGIGAALSGGAHVAQRSLLSYSRGMEQSADQAALRYLDSTGQSARGLLSFMELLRGQESALGGEDNPYTRSHPLTKDRVAFVRNHVAKSPLAKTPLDPSLVTAHRRMRAKINGYLNPAETLRHTDPNRRDLEALYSRSIAYMRQSEAEKSLAIADALIRQSPKDPFFLELRGDILRNAGRTKEAKEAYEETLKILPWAALIRLSLAQTQLELNDGPDQAEVVANLKQALRYEPRIPRAWRQLATAYGRMNEHGLASHALAEEAILRGDGGGAARLAKRAMRTLPKGSSEWLRSQDIELQIKRRKEER